ncbi:MAG: DUF3461 family protein [Motiliproteus sp.]|nr:DUF3461 family protein [Motiliproteus sp.]MCW9054154.1 DUF3461 family protein [Motiliproteus sp.]
MSKYPMLEEMGIKAIDEISHFKVEHGKHADVLKICFSRPDDSKRSSSKKFTFVRNHSALNLQYDLQHHMKGAEKRCDRLERAIAELTELTGGESQVIDQPTKIVEDLNQMEIVMRAKIAEMRSLVETLKNA